MPTKPIIYSLTTMHESGMNRLHEAGQVRMATSLKPEVLHKEIVDADALVIRTAGDINAELMDHAPKLRVIGRHGVGYDQVDVPAATARGIQVVYTPGANTEAVAEHVFAMMIGVSKHFPKQSLAVDEYRHNDRTKLVGRDIFGKTLGIIGFGRIGRRVGAIAKLGFNMRVLYNDIVAAPIEIEERAGATRVSLDQILAESDYLTLHVPLDDSTRKLINAETLAKLKPNAVLILSLIHI